MDDGLECKRCKEADTFEVLCDDCAASVFGRTDRLIARSRQAKNRAETVCKQLGPESLRAIQELDREYVTDEDLFDAFCRLPVDPENAEKHKDRFFLTLHLIKLEDEREGYAELAEMSSRIFFDEAYIDKNICGLMLWQLANAQHNQNWQDQ